MLSSSFGRSWMSQADTLRDMKMTSGVASNRLAGASTPLMAYGLRPALAPLLIACLKVYLCSKETLSYTLTDRPCAAEAEACPQPQHC